MKEVLRLCPKRHSQTNSEGVGTSDDLVGAVVWEWGEDRVPPRRIILGIEYNATGLQKDPQIVASATMAVIERLLA